MVIEVIFMALVIFCTMYFLHTTKQRSMLIGILCIVFNVIMYAAPLTVMVCYMLFSFSFLSNILIWYPKWLNQAGYICGKNRQTRSDNIRKTSMIDLRFRIIVFVSIDWIYLEIL